MLRVSGRIVLTAASLIAVGLVAAAGVSAGELQPLVSEALLEHAGLRTVWAETLPLQAGEGVGQMFLLDDRVIVLSGRNYLFSLDRNGGKTVFAKALAAPGLPILGFDSYGQEFLTVIDETLIELDRDSGRETLAANLMVDPVCPVARNSSFYYVGAADRRVHALRAEDRVRMFQIAPGNDSKITSILADDGFIVFGTDAGNVVCASPAGPSRFWQFDAPESIAGPIVRDGMSFFFANKDTNVYRLDMVEFNQVRLAWKFQADAILDRPPVVTARVVYQYAPIQGVTAIDKGRGVSLWQLKEGLDVLAEAGNRAYVFSKDRTLVVMDNAGGKKRYRVNLASVTAYAVNATDSKIYIADDRGRVACVQPVR